MIKKINRSLKVMFKTIFENYDRNSSFRNDFLKFKQLEVLQKKRFGLEWDEIYPCLNDKTSSHSFDPHYLYHTSWAARKLSIINPKFHVDLSSDLRFATLISAFIPVQFYDYRLVPIELSNMYIGKADLTHLPFDDNSIQSLSCMHVVEHVGLGRYGDTLDYDGDLKAMSELKRSLAKTGSLLFVVPVGNPKIMFNAHRIYSYEQILDSFSGLSLREFVMIKESGDGGIMKDVSIKEVDSQNYACGCFWFVKDK